MQYPQLCWLSNEFLKKVLFSRSVRGVVSRGNLKSMNDRLYSKIGTTFETFRKPFETKRKMLWKIVMHDQIYDICLQTPFVWNKKDVVPIFLSSWLDGGCNILQLNVESFKLSTFWNINLILDLKPSFIMKEANRSKFIMHYVLYQGRNSYFTRLISYKLLFLPRRGKSWSPIVLNCQTLMENWLYVSKKAISKCIWTCHKI